MTTWKATWEGRSEPDCPACSCAPASSVRPTSTVPARIKGKTAARAIEIAEELCDELRAAVPGLIEVEAAGGHVLSANAEPVTPGLAIHEMGTACMGKDPTKSVLNKYNQTHDVPNLFITDGSAMASSG